MLEMFSPGRSLTWDLVWQSSVFLALGLAASVLLRRHPARAHRVLMLAMAAAVVTPLLAQAIRHGGWGLLRQAEAFRAVSEPMRPIVPQITQAEPGRLADPWPGRGDTQADLNAGPFFPDHFARAASGTSQPRDQLRQSLAAVSSTAVKMPSWRQAMRIFWISLSGLAILRFAVSLAMGLRLVRGSVDEAAPDFQLAVAQAATRLGLAVRPEVRSSPHVRCPSVWCWSRQPIMLVPTATLPVNDAIDWIAVFSHELAHWRRLDHLASLAGEILMCVLPWNPLAWWARARLGQFAELACDDWVLACGSEGTVYAASLLELVPQRAAALALAAVSSRGGLVDRLRHILEERRSNPRIGRSWAVLTGGAMTLAVSAVALAQARPAASAASLSDNEGKTTSAVSDAPSSKANTMAHTVRGQILRPDGKPARDVSVVWVGTRKPPVPYVALPRDDDRTRNPPVETLARAQTDAQGKFELKASLGRDDLTRFNGIESKLVVIAPGAGMASKDLDKNQELIDVTLQLPTEMLIHGRLLTPAGQPAKGVRVVLAGFYNEVAKTGMYVGLQEEDDKLPVYWPRPRQTDAEGRFTLEGVPRCPQVSVTFWHPDYAVDEVTVDTTESGTITPAMKGFEIVPVKPNFTHTLEPARPVQGRVTVKASGKPLAGMLVEMIPMRRHGGMVFRGRTDADGRYRISGHSTDGTYFTTVFPPANSGYLDAKDLHQGWPAGAKALEVNFALEKGRLVSGRVIDQGSKQPIHGAAVVYQPAPKNPNNDGSHDLRNTVLTDKDGRFAITTLAGQGILAVEAPDENYIRSPLKKYVYRTVYPHGQLAIDVPKDGTPPPVEIVLRKGVTLEAKMIGPDGQTVKDVTAMYPGIDAKLIDIWNQGRDFSDGVFRIEGADPEKTYRVFFIKPEQRLGAVAEFKYDPRKPGPIELKLQPTATIRGKVVNPDGSPAQGGQVNPFLALGAEKEELSRNDLFDGEKLQFYTNFLGQRNFYFHKNEPGSQGEFVFEAMVPGAWFSISASSGGRVARATTPVLKPGEVHDVGTLTLKEEQR